MAILKKNIKKEIFFEENPKRKHPPLWIRTILILTCTSVSFSHGSNDGQKGVGLIMIILIGLIPTKFAIDASKSPDKLYEHVAMIDNVLSKINSKNLSSEELLSYQLIKEKVNNIKSDLCGLKKFKLSANNNNYELRKNILLISKECKTLLSYSPDQPAISLSAENVILLNNNIAAMKKFTEYAPWWVILMISLSLGVGTMIGWKRIVVTVGEKIGKTPLTYAQGASAELVAASTIGFSTWLGLPVSTTHVLSSGVAGSMVSRKGMKNLRMKTVRNILTAWLITLPVTVLLSGAIFLLLRWIMS